ncbi:DNA polymerase III subunit delta [Martelella sp. HB161492]|uniref:DNA polymerase III subunit delta n=1 Tax=Martelella sp. HB161492 TaxID=2720726 RepID=UPI0015912137|nr:DNA polymerase III subunit delta [Martelella sp. HB161492]
MTEIKSHQFDNFVRREAGRYRLFLVYGPDRGLVSERAALIADQTGVDLADPFSVMKLETADLDTGAGRILDEMNAIGLFGGSRLVWIRGGGSEKPLADAVSILSEAPPESAFLIIEAGELRKGTALRKAAERSGAVAAIPCYSDDARALNQLIDTELATAGLRMTPAARQLLLTLIGGDRLASRNEIEKLMLYARGMDLIDEAQVREIIGDASTISADEAVDAVLSGDPAQLKRAMAKITQSKTPLFLVLNGCLRQFQQLDLMRADMESNGSPVSSVMQSHGRGIFFRRKPLVEAALSRWNSAALKQELSLLQAAVLRSRQYPQLEDSIVMQSLLATTLKTARAARRR